MSDLLFPILAGLTLGSLHAFDADHITAVSVFVSRNPQPRRAVMFGLQWALGHTATLLVFGLTVVSLNLVVSPVLQTLAEMGVGLILIGLGAWAIWHLSRSRKIHIHKHLHDGVEHIHFHSHAERADHHHAHSMFFVGAAHGLAGTAAVLVVIPIALLSSTFAVALYILLFGVGTMLAMAAFAYALGHALLLIKIKNALFWVQGIAGSMSVLLGSWRILGRF